MRWLACVWATCLASAVFAEPLVYEPFAYSPGTLLGQANTTTDTNWLLAGTGTTAINVASGNLVPPPGLASALGNLLTITGIGDSSGASNRLAFASTGGAVAPPATVYFSFLLRVDDLTGSTNTTGGFFIGLNNTGNVSQSNNVGTVAARLQMRIDPNDGTKYNLGIFNNRNAMAASESWSSTPLNVGETLFIVGACALNEGLSNDVSSLWINPGNFGAATAPQPTVSDLTFATNDLAQVASIIVRQSPAPHLTLDELRVGVTWADVTPVLVSCNDPVFDADGDHDVDLLDFAAVQICYGQPALTAGCSCFDNDGSGTIDGFDVEAFRACAPPGGVYRDSVAAETSCDD
jgi:hypothetical protein